MMDNNDNSPPNPNDNKPSKPNEQKPPEKVGGRRLPYTIGQAKYDGDPYRGQRRRPWMCFKVGSPSIDFLMEHFVAIIAKVYNSMIEAGILLDEEKQALKVACVKQDYESLKREIDDALRRMTKHYEEGPLSTPVVIFIMDTMEQHDLDEMESVCNFFQDRIYAFKIDRDEVLNWLCDYEFSELDMLCSQECVRFATFIKSVENHPESLAIRVPAEETMTTFGNDLAAMRDNAEDFVDMDEDATSLEERMRQEAEHLEKERLRRAANLRALQEAARMEQEGLLSTTPPGLGPPGLHNKGNNNANTPSTSTDDGHMLRNPFIGARVTNVRHEPPPGLERYPPGLKPTSFGGTPLKVATTPPGLTLLSPPGIPVPQKAPNGFPSEQKPASPVAKKAPIGLPAEEKPVVKKAPIGFPAEQKPVVKKAPIGLPAEQKPGLPVAQKAPIGFPAEQKPLAKKAPIGFPAEQKPASPMAKKAPIGFSSEQKPLKKPENYYPSPASSSSTNISIDTDRSDSSMDKKRQPQAPHPPQPPPPQKAAPAEGEEIVGDHILSLDDVQFSIQVIKHGKPPIPTTRGVPVEKHDHNYGVHINGSKLYERLEYPFVDLRPNVDLLTVLNYALGSRDPKVHSSNKQLLRGVFRLDYPVSLRKKYLDRLFVTGNWSVDTANLLYELAMLYFNTARYRGGFMLTVNRFVPSWKDISTSFQKCSHSDMTEKGGVTEEELRNMDRLIGHIDKWIKKAQDAAKTAALRSPDISDDDEPLRRVIPVAKHHGGSLNSSDFRGSSAGSVRVIQQPSLESRRRQEKDEQECRRYQEQEEYRERQEDLREEEEFRRESPYTKDYRRYQEEPQVDRRRIEEDELRFQESRRRQDSYQEDSRRYQEDPRRQQDQYHEDSRRRQDSYQDSRMDSYRRSQEEESRRRDEEYRRARDARRAESALGFRSGGGTSSNIQNTVVINDDEYPSIDIDSMDADEEEDRKNTTTSQAESESHLPTHNSDEKPKQPYKYVEGYQDDYEPPYLRCERIEPPEDFKELSAVPTMKDYVDPVEPYLRRIQELGVYKSAHHYLDVQFRLLREDLVSPMRDGMDIYRKNGTCKGFRKENVPCSDISIYNIERVDGKQVTERDGFEMRILWPAQYDIQNLLDNDREMKELGLVMLSGDRFQEDFHLGHIQTSLLMNKGCLHLAVHEETRAFEPNKSYQMAQATSYLPSYKHVLKNLKEISPFKPIPFERYIVHGRKEIYRPNFHQHPKTEDQIQEEERLEKIYTDIRTDAASKRYMAGKPIPRGIDNDYEYSMRDEPEEEDLEYMQLKEPIFRRFVGVDSRGTDLIRIDHKWYKISRLLDDFHPTYLDESQRRAFCSTFKHELSLIQGPPGTGKTHIGVQIVKTMLQNRTHWKMTEPILVVCFTNSGLDNLLERIYDMIENDEELSRDNGKPKMIRYGRKCESDYLKRRRVMRFDVHDQYRSCVSDRAQRDQNKAGSHKRKVGADLVLSSYTLYCSRNDLLSYQILSRVMEQTHQTEIMNFAFEHVDSKENPLNYDEAIACWLLDRDFGKATKQQTKKAKKNKFQEMQSMDSDDETTNPAFLTVQDSDDEEEDDDMDDEKRLDKLFNKMNVGCTGKEILGMVNGSSGDEYYSKGTWEIAHDHRPPEVVLMGKKTKTKQSTHSVDEHINNLVKEVLQMILSTPPLPKHELEDCKHIFSLARPKRWALYVTWCDAVRALVVEGLPKQIADYRKACERLIAAQDQTDSEIMKMPMIIGATTTGCSRLRPILERVEPRILIVEEAAEVLEAHILSAMISSVEHCVMIGDHKQLRPNPAVHELGTEYGLQISMFERLVERALPFSQLQQQHRMNLNISDVIVKPAFYDNVVDAENVGLYPEVEGMATNLYFWSHSKPEESHDGISWMNRHEASMTVALVKHLMKQNYTQQDIVVLTTYAAQRQYFYREFPMMFGTSNDGSVIPVETVDSFQGRERKIAIVSLVRSHRNQQINTGIGFLAVANRICVALTRAQHGMYIVGNGAYIMNNSRLWKQIVDQLNRRSFIEYALPLKCVAHNNLIWVKEPREFAEYSPEGGCLEICNIKKRCGHVCKRPCHPKIEYEHSLRCEYPCQATCLNPQYNHKCARLCFEDCGSCMRLVDVTLECGHTISTPCSRIQIAQCDQKCTKKLVCGHECPLRCGVECADQCEELVTLQLDCSHQKHLKCSLVTTSELDLSCVERCENQMLTCQHQCKELCGRPCTLECQEIVTVKLPCGHNQDVVCSSYEPDQLENIECQYLVTKQLIPCGHKEKVACHQHPSTDNCTGRCTKMLKTCGHMCSDKCGKCYLEQTHVCQHPCPKVLECGHNCPSTCGEPCTPCRAYCQTTCVHQGCGASGSRTYGRNCAALCILCTSHCANKCIHRSCTKKCYEECDVKTCSEPCTEKLKCGHACLGMCGEVCPKVCGSCQRQRYLQCVEGLSLSSQQVHRLIQVPKCLCIVPVEVLDEHVRRLKELGKPLTCCKCKKVRLTGILRYEKYMKRQVLDENLKKQLRRLGALHQTSVDAKIKEAIAQCDDEIRHVSTNMTDENSLIIRTFRVHVRSLNQKHDEIKGKADQKWKMIFILEVARAFRAIAKLISMTSKQRVSSRKDIPPALDGIIQSIGSNPFIKVLDELRKMNDMFTENGKTFMLGAVLQKIRMHTFKMAAYQMISSLMYTVSVHAKQNVPDQAARAILSSCVTILSADDKNDLTSQIGLLEQQVTQVAPKMKDPMSRCYWSWQQLDVPEL